MGFVQVSLTSGFGGMAESKMDLVFNYCQELSSIASYRGGLPFWDYGESCRKRAKE